MPCAALSRRMPARSRSSAASGPKRATCHAPTVRCARASTRSRGSPPPRSAPTSSSAAARSRARRASSVSCTFPLMEPPDPAPLRRPRQDRAGHRRGARAGARVRDRAGAGGRRRRARASATRAPTAAPPKRFARRAPRAAAADGRHARRRDRSRRRRGGAHVRPHRHPGQQRGHRSAQPGRGGHRGRLRSHAGGQPEGDVLRQPGGGPGDDPQRRRAHRQPRLAGRLRRAADRVGLLHDVMQ